MQKAPVTVVAQAAPILSVRNISKIFTSSKVLDNVSFDVMPGEVHGLLGQNGSGKSTLIKILSGYHEPEPGGRIVIGGEEMPLPMPSGYARRAGLSFVHQHLGLVSSLSVLENFLVEEIAAKPFARINWSAERRRALQTFDRFGLEIEPSARIADLPQVERALVAIVRAFETVAPRAGGGGIMVLDEPTPFLPRAGVERLFALVRQIALAGAGVIFVSHDIDEIKEITDRATILRDGKLVSSIESKSATTDDFIEAIVGHQVSYYRGRSYQETDPAVAIRVENACDDLVDDCGLTIGRGEVVGLTGLIGAGFDRMTSLIYGDRKATSGDIVIAGRTHSLKSMTPAKAIGLGIAFLPADRLGAAGVGSLSILDNMTLPVLELSTTSFGLNWAALRRRTTELGRLYQVTPNRIDLPLSALSGGNAQKVLLAKWFQTKPSLMLLNEPVQGVDVGARQRILAAIDEAAGEGTSVVIASTDSEILAQVCHRVHVFSRGKIVKTLVGEELSKSSISEECLRSGTESGIVRVDRRLES